MSILSFLKLKRKDKEGKRSKKEHKSDQAKEFHQKTEYKAPQKFETVSESLEAKVSDMTAIQGRYADNYYSKSNVAPNYYGRYRSGLNRERDQFLYCDSILYSELLDTWGNTNWERKVRVWGSCNMASLQNAFLIQWYLLMYLLKMINGD